MVNGQHRGIRYIYLCIQQEHEYAVRVTSNKVCNKEKKLGYTVKFEHVRVS